MDYKVSHFNDLTVSFVIHHIHIQYHRALKTRGIHQSKRIIILITFIVE